MRDSPIAGPARIAAAAILGVLPLVSGGCSYAAARWRDLTDIVSLGISAGGGIGARAGATRLLAVELIAQKDEIFVGWHKRSFQWAESGYGLLFATWRMPGLGKGARPERHGIDVLTTSRRLELFPADDRIEDIRHTLFVYSGGSGHRIVDVLDLDVGLSALIGGLEATVSPGELADFILGLFTIDIGFDDGTRFVGGRPKLPLAPSP